MSKLAPSTARVIASNATESHVPVAAKSRQQSLVSQVVNLRAELVRTKRETPGGSIQAPSPGRLVDDAPKLACSTARTMMARLRE